MENQINELYHSLSRHFSALCTVPVTLADSTKEEIVFTYRESSSFFCDRCPNRCRLVKTLLYGCREARRWKGRYIFYCPIGLVFSAVSVPETDYTVLAGPLIMGEVQDTLFDLPDYIDPETIRHLYHCSANTLNHLGSILEMAVCGLRYRPEPVSYDRNIIDEEEPDPAFTELKHSDVIYHIMDYIKSNYARKIGLEEIAAYVHLSPSHISSIFHRQTGQTLSAYMNQVRIEKSKPLLLSGETPISDIAALCGFEDQSYFTRVFKKQTGLSPRKFQTQTHHQELRHET